MTTIKTSSILAGILITAVLGGAVHAQTPPATPDAEPAPAAEATDPVAAEPATTTAAPLPETPPTEKKDDKPAVHATYDKGVKLESDDGAFELKLALRTQFRAETIWSTADESDKIGRFSIPRGRLQLEGHVFGKDHRYKLEFSLADKSGFAFTKDLFIEQGMSSGKLWLRVGQWKQPFNRQEMVSDFGSSFNERANTAEFVEGGRDVGFMIHNDLEKSPEGLEWAVGVFQSFKAATDKPAVACKTDAMMKSTCSAGSSAPADFGPALVLRLGWNHGKIKGYSEGDLEGGPLRAAIAVSYKIDLAQANGDLLRHGVGLDALIKVEGLDFLAGVFLMKDPEVDAELGFTGQLGYFLAPKRHQVAARFSLVPDPKAADENQLEIRGAYNLYLQGHAWKWATDFGVVDSSASGAKAEIQVRSMAQLTF